MSDPVKPKLSAPTETAVRVLTEHRPRWYFLLVLASGGAS